MPIVGHHHAVRISGGPTLLVTNESSALNQATTVKEPLPVNPPTCSCCGIQTEDVWHTCLPCDECEHDKPYHDIHFVSEYKERGQLCTWPGCLCEGYRRA